MSEPKVKRRRRPKKPYCEECKIRRVKCDMQKPSCQRCTNRERDCHYFQFTIPPPASLARENTDASTDSAMAANSLPSLSIHTQPYPQSLTRQESSGSALSEFDHQLDPSGGRDAQRRTRDLWSDLETLYSTSTSAHTLVPPTAHLAFPSEPHGRDLRDIAIQQLLSPGMGNGHAALPFREEFHTEARQRSMDRSRPSVVLPDINELVRSTEAPKNIGPH